MKLSNTPLVYCTIACISLIPATGFSDVFPNEVVNKYQAKETPYLTVDGNPQYYSYNKNGVTTQKVQSTMAYRLLTPSGFDATQKYPVVITLHGATGFFTPEQINTYNVRNLQTINGHLVGFDANDQYLDKYIKLKDYLGKSAEELNAYLAASPVSMETFLLNKYNPKGVPSVDAQFTPSNLLQFETVDFPDLAKFSKKYPNLQSKFPTYVIAPQGVNMWSKDDLLTVKSIIAGLPSVDMDRIYVMGQSAGGQGTYTFISADPAYFAAAISASSLGSRVTASSRLKLVNFNLWSIHGDADGLIPYSSNLEFFNDMKSKSSLMKFTTVNGRGHSTGNLLVGRYRGLGSFIDLKDEGLDTEELARYNYNTQHAGPNGSRIPNTLTWLFSNRRLPDYLAYNTWSNAKLLKQGPFGDDDDDGKSNYSEFVAKTNPLDKNS